MNRTQLSTIIREELKAVLEADGMDLKGTPLPLPALKKIGVEKPEYLQVVLAKVKKGERLIPADNEFLANIFLKMMATDSVEAMTQLFNAIRATSAKKQEA